MINKNESILIDLLKQIKKTLDKNGVNFWLDCGTLLGAVRDGRFIEWETDIDLGSFEKDVSEDLKNMLFVELRGKGFNVGVYGNHMNIGKNNVCADLKFYVLNDDFAIEPKFTPKNSLGFLLNYFCKALLAPENIEVNKKRSFFIRLIMKVLISISQILPELLRKRIAKTLCTLYVKFGSNDITEMVPAKYFSKFVRFEFYNVEFNVPEQKGKYLLYRYGKDWMTPRKDWITEKDDGSVKWRREIEEAKT